MSVRKDWGPDEYRARFAELRGQLGELATMDQTSEEYRSRFNTLKSERAILEEEYFCVNKEADKQERRSAGFEIETPTARHEYRSAGELVVADESFANWMKTSRKGDSPAVELRGNFTNQWSTRWEADYELRALVNSASSANLLIPVQTPEVKGIDRQRFWLRDVLAGGTTNSNAVPFIRELNSAANATAATVVAEGAVKPEAKIEFVDDLAPVRDIAITLPVTNQMFEDTPALVSYINNRLSYMLALREEQQLLNGTGAGAEIKGIRAYADVQNQAFTADIVTTIGNSIAKVQVVNGNPNAVAMNTVDYWKMVMHRQTTSGNLDAGDPFSTTPRTVWGLPVVVTNGMEAGVALVGDYRLGAQYFDRSRVDIRTFEQHADYAVRNMRLIRAEERLALAVYRPDWFVEAALA
jgi:HK97 family phage major capsid protein